MALIMHSKLLLGEMETSVKLHAILTLGFICLSALSTLACFAWPFSK